MSQKVNKNTIKAYKYNNVDNCNNFRCSKLINISINNRLIYLGQFIKVVIMI